MLTPRRVRYGGLAGSLLLAAAGFLGGVRVPWRSGVLPLHFFAGRYGVLLPICWVAGTALLIGAWWSGRRVVTTLRWAYVTAGLWLLPMLLPAVLGSRDSFSYACQGSVVAAGHDPYTAGPGELGCPWADATSPTWRDAPAPYGPVFVVLAGLAARLGGSLAGTLGWLRVIAVLGVLLVACCLPVLARRSGVAPERAGWLFLACPLVAVHLISGAHNDALMVGLLVAGLAVVAGGHRNDVAAGSRTGWAALLAGGALLGLAVGVKATAVVVLPFAALLAARPPAARLPATRPPVGSLPAARVSGGPAAGRSAWLPGLLRGVAVVGGAVASLAAVSVGSGLGLGWVSALSRSGDSVQWTSVPTAVGMTVDYLGRPFGLDLDAVPVTRVIGVLVLAAVLIGLCWWAWRRGEPLLGAGLALAATVALAPVFHPWYATWPLAVLAATWNRAGAGWWLLVPCAVASALALPDGTNLALATKLPGAALVTVLAAVLTVRAVRSVRPSAGSRPETAAGRDAMEYGRGPGHGGDGEI
ncbi:MAG: alpha,6-mannosyltransferase [Actinoplanes sp.]|jgi:alpha-1,6-mannosyltransferase|nr:alpha,6-mannosyltransferase [Actinoplanes sp.]